MSWPELRLSEWRDTYDTLHMWLQVVGKVRLTCSPHANHWWEAPLYVTARGLTTSAIPHGEEVFEIRLDFIDHRLDIETSGGGRRTVPLVPMTVADFHSRVLGALRELGIDVAIRPMPVEFEGAIPLDRDVSHASYDREHAERCWRALVAADKVIKEFGCRFTGKQSPAHFFWESFDIAMTRFSGRRAPARPGADCVTREAYSHEVISVGWWPGAGAVDAAFYAYAAPEPSGFRDRGPRDGAVYHDGLKEFLLPYEETRRRPNPKAAVLDFFQEAYEAGAELGGWDRAALGPAASLGGRMKEIAAEYRRVRRATLELCAPLEIEDHVVQPIDDVSPPKWHLAHTTWFFETFLLQRRQPGYRLFNDGFPGVFNSYYQTVGSPYPRTRRGTLSRPTVKEVLAYREAVDEAMRSLIERRPGDGFEEALTLGLHHEQQHQELLVTDIKFILAHNPVRAAYPGGAFDASPGDAPPSALGRVKFDGGVFRLGRDGAGLVFDNEGPAHETLVRPFFLADRLATNGEFKEFVDAGGYRDFRHWLSDGWDRARIEGWTAPMYWSEAVDLAEPVCHLSWYEADAFARWSRARLPTESEWELAAGDAAPERGNFMEDGVWRPRPAGGPGGVRQLFGDAWEWTSSPYVPYPGYRSAEGAFGEYNGKFMNGQYVLRGGSCATPRGHVRRTYRNFFQPEKRWQFTGVRLAWDA